MILIINLIFKFIYNVKIFIKSINYRQLSLLKAFLLSLSSTYLLYENIYISSNNSMDI
jgi:hypothetical protein